MDLDALLQRELRQHVGRVRRYARGERIPAPPIMRRIYETTGGLVTPADFLDLPPPHADSLAAADERTVKEEVE